MLFVSLVLSAILVLVANTAARRSPQVIRWGLFTWAGIALIVCPVFLTIISTASFILLIFLAIALAVWPRVQSRLRSFVPLSLAAFVCAYGLASVIAFQDHRRFHDLRHEYPFESMEDRVHEPTQAMPISEPVSERLAGLEAAVQREKNSSMRASTLREMHEGTTRTFVNSPGFGAMRMMPDKYRLQGRMQSEPREQSTGEPQLSVAFSAADESELYELHEARILDFVNAPGFGLIKDRRNVAGFFAHGFGEERHVKTTWLASRIDLIGLLIHPEPVVYLSDRLPVMEELKKVKTRPLDRFETNSLESIRTGAELVPGGPGDEARLVGAIRSGKQCVECHGGKRGDLLGAFSYRLRRVVQK